MPPEDCTIPTFPVYPTEIIDDPDYYPDLPAADCAFWIWCPCDPCDSWSYCIRHESSCPMEDECTRCEANNAGLEFGWTHACGDPCLGPPCRDGRFVGEGVMVCRCPSEDATEASSYSWSEIPDSPNKCDNPTMPNDVPPPWPTYRGEFDPNQQVPQIVFDTEDCNEDTISFWTWCPCDNREFFVDDGSCTVECPNENTCDTGPGQWIYRGGCPELGPPPGDGNFYGETIAIGFCCLTESSYSESSLSEVLEESLNSTSCSMPAFPWFGWVIPTKKQQYTEARGVALPACMGVGGCTAWVWCPCPEDMESSCPFEYGDYDPDACPAGGEDVDSEPGWWQVIAGGTHLSDQLSGGPCIKGRFFGEVVWTCACPDCESESSISSSSLLSSLSSLSSSPEPEATAMFGTEEQKSFERSPALLWSPLF